LTEYWDDVAKAPYYYSGATGMFFSFDNAKSIHEKAEFVKANGLGGLNAWMVSQDKPTSGTKRDELTKVMKNELFGSAALPALEISPAAISAKVTLTKYTENGKDGYDVKLENTATKEESQTVLALVETAGKTIKVLIFVLYLFIYLFIFF
jgi:chitinase